MNYAEFFESLTGFPPYLWQERLEEDLTAGKSVILRVPTGAGKTWGAVAPFLHGMKMGKPLADRLLYALPLRSLASSLHATVLQKMRRIFDPVSATGKDRDYASVFAHCSLQIGGQKNDPFFESELVFTTIDQLLSSYIFLPVSLPNKLGNINAGALIGSLLVFDELHLLDPDVALGTTIEMLERLKGLCQFVLMTATMSDDAINWLAAKLNAKVAAIPDSEIRSLPAQRTKERTWRYSPDLITADAVHSKHGGGRSIVLMNSVDRAQTLFRQLEQKYQSETNSPDLILLHARYYPEHREDIEARLAGYFGPDAVPANVILVTTQVVEAGMDISAEQLHTEIAPMNALIQRAGRTARYESRPSGAVTVYKTQSLGPYKEQAEIVEATRGQLKALPQEGKLVDFVDEQAWIDGVHAGPEYQKLQIYSNLFARRKCVHEAMDEGQRGKLTQLVRDISSVAVLISENPENINFTGRAWPKLLAVSGIALTRLRDQFNDLGQGQWVAKGADEQENEGPGLSLKWSVLSARELPAQWLLALHPDFASYDPCYGLLLGRGGPAQPIQMSEPPPFPRYQYEFELWTDHANRVAEQAAVMQKRCARAALLLANTYHVPAESIEELVRVVCILHDTGKLAEKWQQRAWKWQNDKDSRMRAAGFQVPPRSNKPIAHTWFDPVNDRELQRRPEYVLPHHAVEGAFAVVAGLHDRLSSFCGDELREIGAASGYTAIARHHGPRSANIADPFQFKPEALTAVNDCVGIVGLKFPLDSCGSRVDATRFSQELLTFARPADAKMWPLYVFLVRRLRLADQASLRPRQEKNPKSRTAKE